MTGSEESLTKRFAELASLTDIDKISDHASHTASSIGLKFWHYSTVYDVSSQDFDRGIGNFPPGFYDNYFSENFRRYDPALRLVQYTNKPFVFSSTFTSLKDEKSLKIVDCFREFGIKDGVGIPVHGAGGHHGFVAWASESLISMNETELTLLHGYSCVLYHKIENIRSKLLSKYLMARKLSEREREILLWILEGKTNQEIAHLLNISENTVKFHLKNVCADFDVKSRIHAAMKALQLGALN